MRRDFRSSHFAPAEGLFQQPFVNPKRVLPTGGS